MKRQIKFFTLIEKIASIVTNEKVFIFSDILDKKSKNKKLF